MSNSKFKKISVASVALLGALAVTTASAPVSAQTLPTQGPVTFMRVMANGPTEDLKINVGGFQFEAATNAPCFTASLENMKFYLSVAQAALLSGKSLSVSFLTCGGVNWIQWIDLVP